MKNPQRECCPLRIFCGKIRIMLSDDGAIIVVNELAHPFFKDNKWEEIIYGDIEQGRNIICRV